MDCESVFDGIMRGMDRGLFCLKWSELGQGGGAEENIVG